MDKYVTLFHFQQNVCAHRMVHILDSKGIVGRGLVLDSNLCSSIISEMTV